MAFYSTSNELNKIEPIYSVCFQKTLGGRISVKGFLLLTCNPLLRRILESSIINIRQKKATPQSTSSATCLLLSREANNPVLHAVPTDHGSTKPVLSQSSLSRQSLPQNRATSFCTAVQTDLIWIATKIGENISCLFFFSSGWK